MGEGRTVGRERGGKERRGEVEDRERKKRREKRGAEGAQERGRERVMFQNKDFTLNATPLALASRAGL